MLDSYNREERAGTHVAQLVDQPSYGAAAATEDDYGATTATNGTIAVGGSVTGRTDFAEDQDWFRVNLTAGVSYRVDVRGRDSNGGTLMDPVMGILDSNGIILALDDDSGIGTDSQILFTAATSGVYYIVTSGLDGEQGTYTLSLAPSATADDYAAHDETTGVVSVNGSVSGTLETNTDTDWFAVNLIANRNYRFDLRGAATGGGTLSDPLLNVRSFSGVIWASDDDSGAGLDAQVTYRAAYTGIHYLEASTPGSGTGNYTLSTTDLGPVDDFAGSSATAGIVTAATTGTSVSGNIGTAGDSDWFRVTLTAGRSYRFRLANGTLPSSHLHLRNAAGSWLVGDEDASGNPEIIYTATTSGTYYLDARGAGAETGTYAVAADLLPVDVAGSTATTGVVTATTTVGTPVTGFIDTAGDTDWFRMTLNAGTTYRFRITNGSLPASHLHLRNAAGSWLMGDEDGNGNPEIVYTPTVTGTYYLDARAAAFTGVGTYSIAADRVATDDFTGAASTTGVVTTTATTGTPVGGVMTPGDTDWFRMTLTAGATYRFRLTNGTLPASHLHLRNAAGSWLAGDEDGNGNSEIVYTATTSGIYYLDARAAAATGEGTYAVAADLIDDYAGSALTGGVVGTTATVGTAVNGVMGAAWDTDWFRLTLIAGATYRFRLTNGTLPGAHLHLRNEAGSWLAGDDDSNGNPEIVFTATTAGTYYLDARAATPTETGTYTVAADLIDDFADSTATRGTVVTTLAAGTSVDGVIGAAWDSDWFSFTLTAGSSYRFRLANGTLPGAHLHLRNAAGSWLTGDEDGMGNPEIVYAATTTGTYYLDVRASSPAATGTYTVAVDNSTPDDYAGSVSTTGFAGLRTEANGSVTGISPSGTLGTGDDSDWFRVSLNAGTSYRFLLDNRTLTGSHVYLRNAAGVSLASDVDGNGDPEFVYTPTTSGSYYVDVRAATATDTGTYTLYVRTPADDHGGSTATTTTISTFSSDVSGNIDEPADTDWFRVTLTAGATYRLRLTNYDLPASHLHVRNAAGSWLAGDDDGVGNPSLIFIPTTTGTYYLDARAATYEGRGRYGVAVDYFYPPQTEAAAAIETFVPSLDAEWAAVIAPPTVNYLDIAQASLGETSSSQAAAIFTALTVPPASSLAEVWADLDFSDEDRHRLEAVTRFELFNTQQRTAFDLLPVG